MDREDYITIDEDQLDDGAKHVLRKNGASDQFNSVGTPYDVNSIMHMGEYEYSKSGEKTIITLQPNITIR